MKREQNELYRFRTGYLKFKSALCDRNTGLLSYPLLLDEIRRFFEAREQIGVVVAQLAELRDIEAIYGWQACDRLLQRAAGVLRTHARDRLAPDTLLAQDGVHQGRFVLFVSQARDGGEVGALVAASLADEVREALHAAFSAPEFAGITPGVRFRAGASLLRENPFFRFERLLRAAVEGAVAPPAEEHAARSEMELEVRDLLRRDAVEVLYQPIVSLERRQVVGYEALLRGPAGTPLEAPTLLFARESDNGWVRDLDSACRRKALEAATTLERGTLLFVNSLPDALTAGPDADGGLSRLMERSGRAPEETVLEIAERRLQDRRDRQPVDELRRLGVRLALDNAGSGYATLKLIEDLRPDFVKIDPTLVRGLESSLVQQEVARSVVAVATRVGSRVVAAGVETEAEAEAARRCGVSLGQGLHLARPRPAAAPGPSPSNTARGTARH